MKTIIPSQYQQSFYDAVLLGQGDIVLSARAGSGKTSTIQEAVNQLPYFIQNKTLLTAFNSHIAKELEARQKKGAIPRNVKVKTIHSLGYGIIRDHFNPKSIKTWVDGDKYVDLARIFLNERMTYEQSRDLSAWEAIQAAAELASKTMLTLTDPKDPMALEGLMDHFGIVCHDRYRPLLLQCVPQILKWGQEGLKTPTGEDNKTYHPSETISYDDMIYLPVALNLRIPTFKLVFVDEVQDFNRCQQEMLLRVKRGGRAVWVGDRFQSIYGFMGADPRSFDRIQELTGAREMPLSICYRCARAIVETAQKIVPDIQPAPDATEGVVQQATEERLVEFAYLHSRQVRNDPFMLLCRVNAPLVSLALDFIRRGVPARVRGKDIGVGLLKLLDAIADMPGFAFGGFTEFSDRYFRSHAAMLKSRRNSAMLIESLKDRIDCLDAVYAASLNYGKKGIGEMRAYLRELFDDATDTPIILSSIHKSKGLEARKVGILRPDLLPHPKAGSPWEMEQERNLAYVAITRAREELYLAGTLDFSLFEDCAEEGFGECLEEAIVEPAAAPLPVG